MSKRRSIWPVILASALAIAVLCGLGAWQLQRLAHKQALLAEIDRRDSASPVELSEAMRIHENGEKIEFMKVSAAGRFLHENEKHLMAVFDGNPGWEVVTPLLAANNTLVLVDRGLVPGRMRDRATRTETDSNVEVTGIIRNHSEGRGPFSPDNDIKANMWFWWDVPAMLESTTMPRAVKPAPFVLHIVPVASERGFPRPVALHAALRNNHLQYAVTWFALAVVLSVMAGLFVYGLMRKSST